MTNKEYITNFCKINISEICKKLNLNRSCVPKKISEETAKKVKQEIEKEIALLYNIDINFIEVEENGK